MTTFAVGPAGDGPFPVAVVFTDGVGYREQVKENARRFAADGYYCVAPDLYYRVGKKFSFDMSGMATGGLKGPEAERMMKAATSVTPENMVSDTRAVLSSGAPAPAASTGPQGCVGSASALAAPSPAPPPPHPASNKP